MTNVYNDKDYENALKLKKKLLAIYFAVLAAGIIGCAVFFVLFLRLPYISTSELESQKQLYLFFVCLISGVEIVFSESISLFLLTKIICCFPRLAATQKIFFKI